MRPRRVGLNAGILSAVVMLVCATTVCATITNARSSGHPNVIIIYVDDLGYGDLSSYGATKVQTPHIDRLAREGRRFTDAHSASAVCTPSRYALLTGEYPFRQGQSGVWGPQKHTSPLLLETNQLTLGKLFQDEGYSTACIGKWHLGFGQDRADFNKPLKPGPLELGFDYYFGLSSNNSENPYVYLENHRVYGWDPGDPLIRRRGPTPYPRENVGKMSRNAYGGAKKAHALYDNRQTGTNLTTKAVEWIEAHQDQPFFLYFATPQIHHPFTPHPRFEGTSQAGMYGDFIHELDWMVGELLQTLDELDLAKETLVIFTSDNGGMYNMGGKAAWAAGHRPNGHLLGFKFGVWEGGHRVPFIARWPGRIEAGSESDHLLSSMDLLGSMASLLGRDIEPDEAVDSFNMLETIVGDPDKPVRDHLILSPRDKRNIGLRKDNWVYIDAQGDGGQSLGDRGGPQAVAHSQKRNSDIAPDGRVRKDAPKQQLYDLDADPAQTANVIRKHPKIAAELRLLLARYRQQSRTRPDSDWNHEKAAE